MDAIITPDVLRWAIDRSHITHPALTARFKKIDEWIAGLSFPTFNQARNMADLLRIPFGYLFVSEIPKVSIPTTDFRKVNIKLQNPLSLDFYDLINDTLRQQNWYKDYILKEGGKELPHLNKFSAKNNYIDITKDIRQVIGIDAQLREDVRNWYEYLKRMVIQIEKQGIIVLRSGVVGNNNHRALEVNEFRGFALYDPIAPFIFINSKDSVAARIFTLAHELAHIWIGESGISNLITDEFEINESEKIETLCNEITVELLVPEIEFKDLWNNSINIIDNIDFLDRTFRVSSIVILRRAYNLKLISFEDYKNTYKIIIRAQKPQYYSPGGNYYNNLFARNSITFVNAIVHYAFEERILLRDAANLLHIKVNTIKKIAEELNKRHE